MTKLDSFFISLATAVTAPTTAANVIEPPERETMASNNEVNQPGVIDQEHNIKIDAVITETALVQGNQMSDTDNGGSNSESMNHSCDVGLLGILTDVEISYWTEKGRSQCHNWQGPFHNSRREFRNHPRSCSSTLFHLRKSHGE